VAGLGLVRPGEVAVSLGTSDTYFGTMAECRTDPAGEGHVFVAPTGGYMSLICFKNGSLARERVRDLYGLDWNGFSRALAAAPPGNDGKLMLPYFEPEIVPRVLTPGVRRFGLRGTTSPATAGPWSGADAVDAPALSGWACSPRGSRSPAAPRATGHPAGNGGRAGCPVFRCEVTNGAALGAALRAATRHQAGQRSWPGRTSSAASAIPFLARDPSPSGRPPSTGRSWSGTRGSLLTRRSRGSAPSAGRGTAGPSSSSRCGRGGDWRPRSRPTAES
jgi:hypothetical protein